MKAEQCNWKDLGDTDKRMSRLMARFLTEAAAHQFHGAVILAPVCDRCGSLHQWRMQTDVTEAGRDSNEAAGGAVLGMLEKMAAGIRSGRFDAVEVDMTGSYDA